MLGLVSIWFGTSIASREIIRERAVYTRERMVNLRLFPYVGSKLFVLAFIVSIQCALLFGYSRAPSFRGKLRAEKCRSTAAEAPCAVAGAPLNHH